jgi:proteasome lid subunit RPN8/RPN11
VTIAPLPIRISEALLAQIPDLLWDLRYERVCILVGQVADEAVTVTQLWKAENRHPDPTDNFALTHSQWPMFKQRAKAQGQEVVGIGHSHPIGALIGPSGKDLALGGRRPANFVYHSPTSLLTWYVKGQILESWPIALPWPYAAMNRLSALSERMLRR